MNLTPEIQSRLTKVSVYYERTSEAKRLIDAEAAISDSILRTEKGSRDFLAVQSMLHAARLRNKTPHALYILQLALAEIRENSLRLVVQEHRIRSDARNHPFFR